MPTIIPEGSSKILQAQVSPINTALRQTNKSLLSAYLGGINNSYQSFFLSCVAGLENSFSGIFNLTGNIFQTKTQTIKETDEFIQKIEQEKKFLQDKLNKVKETKILNCKGVKNENLINTLLSEVLTEGFCINTLVLSDCNLPEFPEILLNPKISHHISSLILNDNLNLTQLPDNMESLFPNLVHVNISNTRINAINSVGMPGGANKNKVSLIELKNTPVTENKYKDYLRNILKERSISSQVKSCKNGAIKIISEKSENRHLSIKEGRYELVDSTYGVELVIRLSQAKGLLHMAFNEGCCSAISIVGGLFFLNQDIFALGRHLYLKFSEEDKKGEQLSFESAYKFNETHNSLNSNNKAKAHLAKKKILYQPSLHEMKDIIKGYSKSLVTLLNKEVWAATKKKAMPIVLSFSKGSGHVIGFLISNEKNDTGAKAVYFIEPNFGVFRIWLEKDSNQLSDFFKTYSNCFSDEYEPTSIVLGEISKSDKKANP